MSPGQAGLYTNALKVCTGVVDPQLKAKVQKLEAAIRFAEDDLVAAQKAIDSCPPQEADTLVNSGCILFKVTIWNSEAEMLRRGVPISTFERTVSTWTRLPSFSGGELCGGPGQVPGGRANGGLRAAAALQRGAVPLQNGRVRAGHQVHRRHYRAWNPRASGAFGRHGHRGTRHPS